MAKRINVVLPEETMQVLDRVAPKGSRSRLISDAVIYYVNARARRNVAEQLREGAMSNARRDLDLAQEWFPLEEQAWQRKRTPAAPRKK